MIRLATILMGAVLVCGPVQANPARDAARAEKRQADALERIARIEKDRARDADRDRRNAARDARSSRRFDR